MFSGEAAKHCIEKDEFAQWKNLEIFHVFCYVWYKHLNFWFEYGDLNFQSMKFPLSISHIFKCRRLDPWFSRESNTPPSFRRLHFFWKTESITVAQTTGIPDSRRVAACVCVNVACTSSIILQTRNTADAHPLITKYPWHWCTYLQNFIWPFITSNSVYLPQMPQSHLQSFGEGPVEK